METIHILSKYHGADIDKVEEVRVKKVGKRGGFEEKVFLIEMED